MGSFNMKRGQEKHEARPRKIKGFGKCQTNLLESLLDNYRRVHCEFEITDECEKKHFDSGSQNISIQSPLPAMGSVSRIASQEKHKASRWDPDLAEWQTRPIESCLSLQEGKSLKKANQASCLWSDAWKEVAKLQRSTRRAPQMQG